MEGLEKTSTVDMEVLSIAMFGGEIILRVMFIMWMILGIKDKAHERHAKEMGLTNEEYKRIRVGMFVNPLTDNMEEMVVEGRSGYYQVYRYDYGREILGIARNGEEISSCYKFGSDDWERLIERNGRKD